MVVWGSQARDGLKYHVEDLGLYPPGCGGALRVCEEGQGPRGYNYKAVTTLSRNTNPHEGRAPWIPKVLPVLSGRKSKRSYI